MDDVDGFLTAKRARVDYELPLIQTGFVLSVGTVLLLEHYKRFHTCRDTTADALPVTAHRSAALKMQESIARENGTHKDRIVRTSSLDELREKKKLNNKCSPNHVQDGVPSPDRPDVETNRESKNGSMGDGGHRLLRSLGNDNLKNHDESLPILTQSKRETASTLTELDVDEPSCFRDTFLDEDISRLGNTDVIGRATVPDDMFFSDGHPWSFPWHRSEEKFPAESPSHSVTASTQIFPSPYSVEMVPVYSTICSGSLPIAHAPKKPRTTKESATKLHRSTSPRKKTRKRGWKSSSQETLVSTTKDCQTHFAFHCDACGGPPFLYQDRTPFLHSQGYLILGGDVDYPPDVMESSTAGDGSGSFSRETLSSPRPISSGVPCLPAYILESCTTGLSPNASSTILNKPSSQEKNPVFDKNESFTAKKTPVKRATRGSGSTDKDSDYAPTRLCPSHKRGRKARDQQMLAPTASASASATTTDTDSSPHPQLRAILSTEGPSLKPTAAKREHPFRGGVKSETSGRTTFADMVHAHLVRTGTQKWAVGHDSDVIVTVKPEGSILYKGIEYKSISSFALAVIRERNPGRRSCDGWKDVKYEGQRLETLRERYLCR